MVSNTKFGNTRRFPRPRDNVRKRLKLLRCCAAASLFDRMDMETSNVMKQYEVFEQRYCRVGRWGMADIGKAWQDPAIT